jgi:hypothetical protein
MSDRALVSRRLMARAVAQPGVSRPSCTDRAAIGPLKAGCASVSLFARIHPNFLGVLVLVQGVLPFSPAYEFAKLISHSVFYRSLGLLPASARTLQIVQSTRAPIASYFK